MPSLDRFTCEETFRRLDDYLDRELGPEEIPKVQEHLGLCEACAQEFRFEASLVEQIRSRVRRLSAPATLLSRISAVLAEELGA